MNLLGTKLLTVINLNTQINMLKFQAFLQANHLLTTNLQKHFQKCQSKQAEMFQKSF